MNTKTDRVMLDAPWHALEERARRAELALARESRERSLLERIACAADLESLLAALGEEIDALGFDGYLINLLDGAEEQLVCQAARLPAGYGGMERTLLRFRFPLNLTDPNTDAFASHQTVVMSGAAGGYRGTTSHRLLRWGMRALAVVPVLADGEAIGTVTLLRQRDEIEAPVLAELAQRLSLFTRQIQRLRTQAELCEAERSLRHAGDEQRRFLSFVTEVNRLLTPEGIYSAITDEFFRRFPADLVGLLTRRGDVLEARHFAVRDARFDSVRVGLENCFHDGGFRLSPVDGASAAALLEGQAYWLEDAEAIRNAPMFTKDRRAYEAMVGLKSFLIVPIRDHDKVTGVFWLGSLGQPMALSELDLDLIELIGDFIGTALANAELYELIQKQKREIQALNESLAVQVRELDVLASRDRLTGLGNFRHFEDALASRLEERLRAPERPLSVVLIDVDHFKRFNDAHGHLAGNEVLMALARRIEQHARRMDIACRYGGEEFVVILPSSDLAGARAYAERLREDIQRFPLRVDLPLPVTLSAGCAQHRPGETAVEFIDRADRALYQAKQRGRNRVEVG